MARSRMQYAVALAFLLSAGFVATLSAQESGTPVPTDRVIPGVFNGDLRDLPAVPRWQPGDR